MTPTRLCLWCRWRRHVWPLTGHRWFLPYGRTWERWRARHDCRLCSPPRQSAAGRLAIARNALYSEVLRLREVVQ